MHWWKWAAAAVVLLAIAGAGYFYFSRPAPQATLAATPATKQPAPIKPGTQKAILTLADGSTVVLDSTLNGTFAKQGNMQVTRQNGQLHYTAVNDNAAQPAAVYNTVATPRGGQYQLILGDGTKVWLNAASSMRFPAGFTGATRDVEVTGEAYFEVAKDAVHPFRVFARGAVVRVLGTHFNINAYDDESDITTTLLEGSVKIYKNEVESILKPGDQAQLDKSGHINLLHDVNVQEVVAWKDGFFQFDNAGIKTVMRQLSRWYDVDVEYRGTIDPSMSFEGKMGRDLRLQQVLKILQKSEVHFAIEGRNIIVVP
jgi:transmembrane sensor